MMRLSKYGPGALVAGIALAAAFVSIAPPALAQAKPAAPTEPALLPAPTVTKAAAAPAPHPVRVRTRTTAQTLLKAHVIELPPGDDVLPDRRNAEAADRNCLACHSSEMILNQPALPRAVWAAEVEKMRSVYKASIDLGDVDAILDYLTTVRGESRRSWR